MILASILIEGMAMLKFESIIVDKFVNRRVDLIHMESGWCDPPRRWKPVFFFERRLF